MVTIGQSAFVSWTVRVRWLQWRPWWQRRTLRAWAVDAAVPSYMALKDPGGRLGGAIFVYGITIILAVVIFAIGLIVAVATWIAAAGGILVSAASHVIVRRPYLVEAFSSGGEWCGWWVVGLRPAHRMRDEINSLLALGTPVGEIQPRGAIRQVA